MAEDHDQKQQQFNRLVAFFERRLGAKLRRRTDAQELANETLKHVEESLGKVSLSTARKRVWNNCLRRHYADKRSINREDNEFAKEPSGQPRASKSEEAVATPSQMAANREALEKLDNLVGDLSAVRQNVIRLRYEEDLTYSEIAKQIGKSTEAVRKILKRELKEIEKTMRAQGFNSKPYDQKTE